MFSRFSPVALLLAAIIFSNSASSMQPGFFGDAADSETAAAATASEPRAAGRVVAVDPTGGQVTLEYRPIPQHFLEGGTRIFRVEDPSSLVGLTAGDRVRFDVEREGRYYVVTHIENSN